MLCGIYQNNYSQLGAGYDTVEPRLSGLGGTRVNSPDNWESG